MSQQDDAEVADRFSKKLDYLLEALEAEGEIEDLSTYIMIQFCNLITVRCCLEEVLNSIHFLSLLLTTNREELMGCH